MDCTSTQVAPPFRTSLKTVPFVSAAFDTESTNRPCNMQLAMLLHGQSTRYIRLNSDSLVTLSVSFIQVSLHLLDLKFSQRHS